MRLCIITGYPPNIGRGAESSWLLAEELAKQKEVGEVCVLANLNGKEPEAKAKLKIFRVWKENHPASIFKLISKIRQIKPDAVHMVYSYLFYGSPFYSALFTFFLCLSLKCLNVPLVVTIHQIFPFSAINKDFQSSFHTRIPAGVIKAAFWLLNKIIAWSSRVVICLHRRYPGILSRDYGIRNTFYIPIGLKEIRPGNRDEAKQALGVKRKFHILFFGFLAPFKGVEYAVEAMQILRGEISDALLTVAGSILPSMRNDPKAIEYIKKLKDMVRENGLEGSVAIRDYYIPEEEAALLFSSADIVLIPYREQSGPSEIFKKAALYKIPVVASDIDYLREDIKNGITGILVPPRQPAGFSSAIGRLYHDRGLYQSIRENISRTGEEYDIRHTAVQHLEVYRSAYEKRRIN